MEMPSYTTQFQSRKSKYQATPRQFRTWRHHMIVMLVPVVVIFLMPHLPVARMLGLKPIAPLFLPALAMNLFYSPAEPLVPLSYRHALKQGT